jgi:hypothetical protein
MADWANLIRTWTTLLRHGTNPLHARVRALVREHGIDLDKAMVISFLPEGGGISSGVLVTESGEVYEFEVDRAGRRAEDAELITWRDLTEIYESRAFQAEVPVARRMLARRDPP